MKAVVDFLADEGGLTVVEYVVGAGLLIAVVTGVFLTLETDLSTKISSTFN